MDIWLESRRKRADVSTPGDRRQASGYVSAIFHRVCTADLPGGRTLPPPLSYWCSTQRDAVSPAGLASAPRGAGRRRGRDVGDAWSPRLLLIVWKPDSAAGILRSRLRPEVAEIDGAVDCVYRSDVSLANIEFAYGARCQARYRAEDDAAIGGSYGHRRAHHACGPRDRTKGGTRGFATSASMSPSTSCARSRGARCAGKRPGAASGRAGWSPAHGTLIRRSMVRPTVITSGGYSSRTTPW